MHELSVMQSILDIVLDFAKKNNAKQVTKINLEVGEMSGIVPDWMQKYFDFVSEGTIAEKSVLNIDWVPAVIKCRNCGKEFKVDKKDMQFFCSKCESKDIELISGRGYLLKSIEIS